MKNNLNSEYHRLLEVLSIQHNKYLIDDSSGKFHLSYEEIQKQMNCDRFKLNIISSPLLITKEVVRYSVNGETGLCVGDVGFSAWASEKYKTLHYEKVVRKRLNYFTYASVLISFCLGILSFVQYSERSELENRVRILEKTQQEFEESNLGATNFCHSCKDK